MSALIKQRASQLLTKEQDSKVAAVRATRMLIRLFLGMYCGFTLFILATLGVMVRPTLAVLVLGGTGVAVWAHVSYFRRLRALELPPEYITRIRQARFVTYGAIVAIFGIVLWDEVLVRLTTG